MTEVVGWKRSKTLTTKPSLLTLTLLFLLSFGGSCNSQREEFDQDTLPKFSTLLKERSNYTGFPVVTLLGEISPTQNADSALDPLQSEPTGQLSLWEMMKKNFNQGLQPAAATNSVFAPNPGLSSSWKWASKLVSSVTTNNVTTADRSTRDASSAWHGTNHLAWDTAKLMGSVGKGLLSSYWAKSVVIPNNAAWSASPITNFKLGLGDAITQKMRDYALANFRLHDNKATSFRESFFSPLRHKHAASGGWGKSPQILVVQPEVSLLERWIRAKLSITQHLLLAKLRLHKTLITSTVPGAIKIKLNLINTLLNLVAEKDVAPLFRTLRLLRQALWRGKRNFWMALVNLRSTPSIKYGVSLSPSPEYGANPQVSPQYGPSVTLTSQYGKNPTPSLQYGANPIPSSQYGNGDILKEAGYPSQPNLNYGASPQTPTPQQWSTLKNPLYAFPSYRNKEEIFSNYADFTKHQEEYATLPPVVSLLQPPTPHYPQTGSTSDAVIVSGKFLRDLMRQSLSSTQGTSLPTKADLVSDVHSHRPRSNNVVDYDTTSLNNKFSTQLLQSGFTRS